MIWKKLGRLFDPETSLPDHPKLVSHAANPLPVQMHGDLFRVFFSARDGQRRSSVGAVDIDIARRRIERVLPHPVFEHGPAASFLADGVSIGNVYAADGRRFMLFMAWQVSGRDHWRGEIGRLELHDDLSLSLVGDAPLLSVDATDPVSLSYPWVSCEAGKFHMWYGSTLTWDAGNGEMLHLIREATSADGSLWARTGRNLPHQIGVAQAFSRPTVAQAADGGRDMWFSYRGAPGRSYRIGYAHMPRGGDWALRLDQSGLDISQSGWDSEMVEYPFVFDHRAERYMLYNGNDYGRSGFGLARLEA